MGLRSTCAVVVPLVVGGLLALPATGAQSPPAPSGAAALAALPGVLAAGDQTSALTARTVQSALTSVQRHADTSARLQALAAAHRAAAPGAAAPLLLTAEEPDEPVPAEPEPVLVPFAAGVAAGDLDGDGTEDVLVGSSDGESLDVRAVRGTDGSTLWSSDDDGSGLLAFPLGRDATGDGRDDLLLHVVIGIGVVQHTDREDGFDYDYSASLGHTVALVSGADGRTVWLQSRSGTERESASQRSGPLGLTSEFTYTRRSDGADVLALLSDDLTGDGLPDVLLEAFDLDVDVRSEDTGAAVAGVSSGSSTVRAGTLAEVLDGTDGETVGRREVRDTQDLAVLVPVGQVAGSPLADLAWISETVPDQEGTCVHLADASACPGAEQGQGGVGLQLLEGAGLTPLWQVAADGAQPFALPLRDDADADGTPDLVLYVDAPAPRVELRSGDDGGLLWQHASGEDLQTVLGSATDGAARVLVLAAYRVEVSTVEAATQVVVERRDAATGALRSTKTHRSSTGTDESSFGFVLVGDVADDADGDGRPELVVGTGVQSGDTAQSTGRVEDLGTGRVVHEQRTDDLRATVGFGDLDGDGLVDLGSVALEFDDSGEGPGSGVLGDLTALRAVDGRVLWRASGDLFDLPLPAGDQDGRPGVELLVSRTGDDPAVSSLRGADLVERWRVPAVRPTAPVPPPLPSTG